MKHICVKHAASLLYCPCWDLLTPSLLLQLLPLLQGVLRSLEGVALTHPCLHQEHPMTLLLLHPAGSWSTPGSLAGHSNPPYSAAHSLAAAAVVAAVAAGSAALSAAAEQSSAAAESAAAAC